jgi:hypothetical protein
MKYLKTFETYNITTDEDITNEGLLGSLKGFLGKLFQNINKIFTEQGDKVIKEIEAKKNPKDVFNTMKGFLDVNKQTFTTEMNNSASLNKVRDAVYSNVVLLDASFKAASTKLNNNKVSFEQIFGNETPKEFQKIFSQKDEKNKQEMVVSFSNSMVENMGKGIGIQNFEELKLNIGEEAKPSGMTATSTTTEAPTTNQPNTTPEQNVNTSYKFINEAATDDQLKNIKKIIIDWFNNNVYMKIYKNLAEIEKNTPNTATTSLDQQINNIKITNNKDGVKKMVNAILNFDDDKKLGDLRDAMVKLGYINMNDVGKF